MVGRWVDAVGGMAVGAVPLVSAVLSAAAHHDPGTKLLGFFVRKEPKAHGLGRQIEGGFAPGQTVALVEDTCTTGGSTLQALDIVERPAATWRACSASWTAARAPRRPSRRAASRSRRCSRGRTCRLERAG